MRIRDYLFLVTFSHSDYQPYYNDFVPYNHACGWSSVLEKYWLASDPLSYGYTLLYLNLCLLGSFPELDRLLRVRQRKEKFCMVNL